MSVLLEPHKSIDGAYTFSNPDYKDYMVKEGQLDGKLHPFLHIKPAFIHLVAPIRMMFISGTPAYVTPMFEGFQELPRSHFRRFYEMAVNVIEFLESKDIFHPELWNHQSIWVRDSQYFIPPFRPSQTTTAHRSLKDAFILAFNTLFVTDGVTFTNLKELIEQTPQAAPLASLHAAIDQFDGDYTTIYQELRSFKSPFALNDFRSVLLSENKAEQVVQQCVLRSMKLLK